MTITIHLQPGETISQALIRAGMMAPPGGEMPETITIPPGTHTEGANLRKTRIIERRTTGIPFLNPTTEICHD
jgi:hypothetical protein